ncbi:MAG: hypothetical protein ABS79_00935 [Planctomycetes bacterium SCN 63-9]|nr:MAG: hypothetical protein ABS79_00935 [Planctomycetes bacterium SCN 63-9]
MRSAWKSEEAGNPDLSITPQGPSATSVAPPLIDSIAALTFARVAYKSLFADIIPEAKQSAWRPLTLRSFFTDGWLEPFVEPSIENGATPRSGWVNSFEGAFFRSWFFSFSFAKGANHNGDEYHGGYTIYTPLSRRLEFRIDVPFVASNKGGLGNSYQNRFGDLVISPRFLLSETLDFCQVFAINVRTPTGSRLNGNGLNSVSPHYQFWYSPRTNWSVRGGTGVTVMTNDGGGGISYFANVGIGRYWKGDEDAMLRHHWLSLVMNFNTPQSGSRPNPAYLSLTPGYRVEVSRGWFLLAGLECPLTRDRMFAVQPIFLFVRQF